MNGAITWHELITSDVEAATRFYTELLGLELETADMGDFQYSMLKKGGRTHAGFVKPRSGRSPVALVPVRLRRRRRRRGRPATANGAQLYHGPLTSPNGFASRRSAIRSAGPSA